MSDDEMAIRDVTANWIAATKRGDLEAVLDLMEEDVVFLAPGAEPFGKAAFAEASRSMAAGGMTIDGESEVLEVNVLGEWAFMTNRLRITASRPGASDMVRCVGAQGGRGYGSGRPTFTKDGDEQSDKGGWMSVWVEDVDAVYARCIAEGLEVAFPPTDMPWCVREIHVGHPDGHVFCVSRGLQAEESKEPTA